MTVPAMAQQHSPHHLPPGEVILNAKKMEAGRAAFEARQAHTRLPAVHQWPWHPRLSRQIPCTSGNCGNLNYHGGPVQLHPQTFLVLWGPKWENETTYNPFLSKLMLGLGVENNNAATGTADRWLATTHEYGDGTNGSPWFYANGINGDSPCCGFASAWIDLSTPPTGATQGQLGAEAVAFAQSIGLTPSSEDDIIVATQQGTCPLNFAGSDCPPTSQGYCAWHTYAIDGSLDLPFINLPYMPEAQTSCTPFNHPKEIYSAALGHETAETITDPLQNAWFNSGGGGEVADECPGYQTVSFTGDPSITMQSLYSNHEADASGTAGDGCTYGVAGPLLTSLGPITDLSGKNCIDNANGSTNNGNAIIRTTCDTTPKSGRQMFTDDPVSNDLVVQGKCIDDPSDGGPGTKVQLWNCNGNIQQQWVWSPDPEGTYGNYEINNGTLCLAHDSTVGDPLTVQTCNDASNQQWSGVDLINP